ncbi:unnamed protein product [Xylocopa violacea]|uniref:CCHC-type domain-containing protein n=1 Tax=Xylocopa violacea TaxID=135666 RepID=A0ABP1N8N5_XYLVO
MEVDNNKKEQTQVVRLLSEPWEKKVAMVRVPVRMANILKKRKEVKIGWTNNRISMMEGGNIKCWKCGRWGHETNKYNKDKVGIQVGRNEEDREVDNLLREQLDMEKTFKETENIFNEHITVADSENSIDYET